MLGRRGFGKSILGGAAGIAMAAATPLPSTSQAAEPQKPKTRKPLKVRLGGEYRIGDGGTISKQNLDYQGRWGITYLTTSVENGPRASPGVADPPPGAPKAGRMVPSQPWNLDALKHMQDVCQQNGKVLEGIRMDSAYMIMKPGPERDRYLDLICDNVRKAGQAGITVISKHWSVNFLRRNTTTPGRGNSSYTGFTLEKDWKNLPPTGVDPVSSDEYWERIDTFLKHVIPVARESKVKMAVHPYDPGGLPLGYLGVDNWDAVDFVKAMLRYEKTFDDPHNAFQYDTGVAAESMDGPDLQFDLLRGLVTRGKVAQIHFRNIRGHLNDFVEVYHDEGDVNLFAIIKLLRDLDWEGSLLPDHSPVHPDDPQQTQGFAFANGYIAGLLKAAQDA